MKIKPIGCLQNGASVALTMFWENECNVLNIWVYVSHLVFVIAKYNKVSIKEYPFIYKNIIFR